MTKHPSQGGKRGDRLKKFSSNKMSYFTINLIKLIVIKNERNPFSSFFLFLFLCFFTIQNRIYI